MLHSLEIRLLLERGFDVGGARGVRSSIPPRPSVAHLWYHSVTFWVFRALADSCLARTICCGRLVYQRLCSSDGQGPRVARCEFYLSLIYHVVITLVSVWRRKGAVATREVPWGRPRVRPHDEGGAHERRVLARLLHQGGGPCRRSKEPSLPARVGVACPDI